MLLQFLGADSGTSPGVSYVGVARRIGELFDVCHELEIHECCCSKLKFFHLKVAIPVLKPLSEWLFLRSVLWASGTKLSFERL